MKNGALNIRVLFFETAKFDEAIKKLSTRYISEIDTWEVLAG